MWRKHGVFRQFLLSYLCVLIPMLILSLWQVDVMRSNRAEELRQQLKIRLAYAGERFDEQVSRYEKIAALLSNDLKLLPNKMLGSVQDAQKGIERLSEVEGSNPELQQIFMIYGDGKVYSSNGMSRIGVFLSGILTLNDEDAERVRVCVQSDSVSILKLKTGLGKTWILSHFPARSYRNNAHVSVNFLIDENTLIHIAEQTIADSRVYISLAPKGEAPVFYSCQEKAVVESLPEKYYRTCHESLYFHLQVYFDENTLLAADAKQWMVWYAVVASFMILLLALSILLSKKHYRPIESIVRMTHSGLNISEPDIPAQNEYEYIGGLIKQMVAQSGRLTDQLAREKEMVLRQSATLIFNGIILTHPQIKERMDFSDVSLDTDYFAVAAVSANTPEQIETVKAGTKGLLCYEAASDAGSTFFVMFGVSGNDLDGAERSAIAKKLTNGEPMSAGISGVYDDLEKIVRARMEAEQALKNSSGSKTPVICRNVQRELAGKLSDLFVQAVSAKNSEQALSLLEQLQSLAADSSEDLLEHARQTVFSAMVALSQEDPECEICLDEMHARPDGGDSGWEGLKKLVEKACSGNDRNEIVASALAYIRDHFTDNALSLDAVAGHCGVTPAYLSRLFKRRMGVGYIDYVTELRMNEARNLLVATSLPVSDIAERVGYLNVSSFRKKFKLVTGMSLSEYRIESRKEE